MNLPMPPLPQHRPPVSVFYHSPAELAYVAVDRITSITVVAPSQVTLDGIWRVRVTMGADSVERRFEPEWYMPDAQGNVCKAFAMARDDAVIFARELAAHLNAMKERR